MEGIAKKIFKVIVDVLTLIVFVALIIIIFSKVKMMISDSDYFDIFGYSFFRVDTGSMKPVINENDISIIKSQKDYNENDSVTFKSEKAYITHRIVSRRGDTIVTKGDANNTKDTAISINDVIGKVVKVVPKAGMWQKIFSSPKIIIMILLNILIPYIFFQSTYMNSLA